MGTAYVPASAVEEERCDSGEFEWLFVTFTLEEFSLAVPDADVDDEDNDDKSPL
jgi:hypothetical protein